MKLSLKFHNTNENQQTQIMTAKLPITIFNHPLLSTITATGNSTSDFSFSLSTNFPTGPTLKLSYTPTATNASSLPFSLSLKSGLGLSGSPRHSPLVFSANLSLSTPSSTIPLLLPSFSLHFKPQFGHFSLHKTVFSDSNPNPNPNTNNITKTISDSNPLSVSPQFEKGFLPVQDGCSSGWQNLNLEPFGHRDDNNNNNNVVVGVGVVPDGKNSEKHGLSPSVAVMARTILPVTQGLLLKFRWGVNFPGNKSGLKIPYLTVNKIGLERVEEVKLNELNRAQEGDLQMVKDVCLMAKGDLENVEKENKEMKKVLDEMKMRVSRGEAKLVNPKKHLSGESFQTRASYNNNNDRKKSEKKQPNKSQNVGVVSDLESELEKAIKAATATAASSS
ncbi:uncharacterized protein LOC127120541 [Lathyrus oleraceus]|uniref:Uncharacterized protein n=1 Tax=Pisum sativum TaxID=3888 RepID=A0A9D4YH97_PEA|nr:uncharacterized protein LOC127120541 [Pisum sativum]KAI5439571.1 hypothetical protein KIW84_025095 [Pisum sativum]